MRQAALRSDYVLPICWCLAVVMCLGSSSAQPVAQKAKPRGRLPAYYKDLVSPEQREEIYAIQARFGTTIADLKLQIERLEKERDLAVESVLTPAQKARLELLKGAKGKMAGDDAQSKNPLEPGKKEDPKKDVFPK